MRSRRGVRAVIHCRFRGDMRFTAEVETHRNLRPEAEWSPPSNLRHGQEFVDEDGITWAAWHKDGPQTPHDLVATVEELVSRLEAVAAHDPEQALGIALDAARAGIFAARRACAVADELRAQQDRWRESLFVAGGVGREPEAGKRKAGVYFIRATGTGLIKIGYTGDIKARMSTLQNANGDPLELLHHMRGSMDDEHALHKRFASARAQREWFRPEPELLAYIDGLRSKAAG